jgi:hypothetical protein
MAAQAGGKVGRVVASNVVEQPLPAGEAKLARAVNEMLSSGGLPTSKDGV